MASIISKSILLALFLSAANAFAFPVQDYEARLNKDKNSQETVEIYVLGLGTGYAWSNTVLENEGRPLLYCQPRTLSLTNENYIRILDAHIARIREYRSDVVQLPVAFVLLRGLVHTFPCRS